jgi:hypothetical protein
MRVVSWDVGLRTLSYCTLQGMWNGEEVEVKVEQWDSIDVQTDEASAPDVGAARGATSVAKRAKGEVLSVERGAELLMETLHRRAELFDGVDAIVIEQQPAGGHNRQGNVRMKVMSHAIQCYFYTRALLRGGPRPVITFVSPASKLVEMERTPRAPEDGGEGEGGGAKKQYKQNKQFAIAKTGELLTTVLQSSTAAVSLFQSSNLGKKDDLADSLLLGYYYLLKQVSRGARVAARDSKAAEKEAKALLREQRALAKEQKEAAKAAKREQTLAARAAKEAIKAQKNAEKYERVMKRLAAQDAKMAKRPRTDVAEPVGEDTQ